MGKKVAVVVLIVVGVFCLCSVLCVIGVTYGTKVMMTEAAVLKEQSILPICNMHGDLTDESVGYFTQGFAADYELVDAQELLGEAFPSSLDCDSLLPTSFWTMVLNGQQLSIESINGNTTAEFSFDNGSGTTTISLVKNDEVGWLINDVVVF